MSKLRATILLTGFVGLTLPLMPVQWALIKFGYAAQRRFPHWYHRQVCRLLGIRIRQTGAVAPGKNVLLVSNHVSWLDIPVMSAIAPVSFVAKREVGAWPFIGWLAKLQRSVFVDRERRTSVDGQTGEIRRRLAEGDTVVLFPEGTTGDGNRTLPFKSSLFGAVGLGGAPAAGAAEITVQPMTIAYTGLGGLALGRFDRPLVAWYGDMEAAGHAWHFLGLGPVDVAVTIGEPVPLAQFADRKALARATEAEIAGNFRRLLRPSPAAGRAVASASVPADRNERAVAPQRSVDAPRPSV